jgi:glycosyltransferase involved in cell wall biosynthesis
MTLDVSIIIATRDRADSLARCLEALSKDESGASREIIVVDNGSSDHTSAVIKIASQQAPFLVRHVKEPRSGQSHARNRGVTESRGDFLLFTDDDVTTETGWIDAHLNTLQMDGVGGAGGRILPQWESSRPGWLDGFGASTLELVDYGEEPFDMQPGRLPIGANMSIHREWTGLMVPLFDPRLGHNGRISIGAEETLLFSQICRVGRVVYAPDALVRHHIPDGRADWTLIRRRVFQGGFGIARMESLLGSGEHLSLARRAVRASRVCRGAWQSKRLNEKRAAPTAGQANEEFLDFAWAGMHLERLFGRSRWLANQLAARLV